jgi:hypothetical protein
MNENLRKAAHSAIERRRRQKINAAYDKLKQLNPQLQTARNCTNLHILERTVAYILELENMVQLRESLSQFSAKTTLYHHHNQHYSPSSSSPALSPSLSATSDDRGSSRYQCTQSSTPSCTEIMKIHNLLT